MRVATIDIGTNTVLLLVAERREDGTLVALDERATITRLGEGVDVSRRLSKPAIARTNACIDAYAKVIRDLSVDRVSVVGTSAMRDGGGGDELRKPEDVWILVDEVFDDGAVFQILEEASYELLQNFGGVVCLELTVGDHLVVLGFGDGLDGGVVGVGGWVG